MIINGKEARVFGSLWRFIFNYLSGEKKKMIRLGFDVGFDVGFDAGFGELNRPGFGFVNLPRWFAHNFVGEVTSLFDSL